MLTFLACYGPATSTSSNIQHHKKPMQKQSEPIRYYADINGDNQFQEIEVSDEQKPKPRQGNDLWMREFYKEIKYPASARSKGIGGLVVLEITVSQSGQVENVIIKQSVSKECDEEAKRAYLLSIKNGYAPLIYNEIPVRFKTTVPVGFWLICITKDA